MIAEFLESGNTGEVRGGVVRLNRGNDESRVEDASVGVALERRRTTEDGNLLFGRQIGFVDFLRPAKREPGDEFLQRRCPTFTQIPLFGRRLGLPRQRDRLLVNPPEERRLD